jgi:putative transposase
MKQRHSFNTLLFHLVFRTKQRERLIRSEADGFVLRGFMETKAHELDVYLEEFGFWCEHTHLLLRSNPTIALADAYRHLKGFSSHAWNLRSPDRPFRWADGVWAVTVSPGDTDALRNYIRQQWDCHERRAAIPVWEPPHDSPLGLARRAS